MQQWCIGKCKKLQGWNGFCKPGFGQEMLNCRSEHSIFCFAIYLGRNGVLVQEASVHGFLQKFFPILLPTSILYVFHYLTWTRNPRERRIYDTMRAHFFLSHIANNIHITVKNCGTCDHSEQQTKHWSKLQTFPTLWSTRVCGNQHFRTITQNFVVKLAQGHFDWPSFKTHSRFSTAKTKSGPLANICHDNLVLLYGIQNYVFPDNSRKSVGKFSITSFLFKRPQVSDYHCLSSGTPPVKSSDIAAGSLQVCTIMFLTSEEFRHGFTATHLCF